jgi:peptide/nickel transport system permease protein
MTTPDFAFDDLPRRAGLRERLSVLVPASLRGVGSDKTLQLGAVMCAAVLILISIGPMLYGQDAQELGPDVLMSPSAAHLLGTDSVGRDVLARLMLGTRSSLFVAVVATLFSMVLGTALGVAAGYLGRATDWTIMRVVDVLFSIPPLLKAITILAAIGPSIPTLIAVLILTYTPQTVRVVRASTLQMRDRGFIESARISGVRAPAIMTFHIVPNIRSVLVAKTTITLAHVLMVETILSFLGMGVQPPTPSLGFMVAEGRQWMELAPWVVVAPGLVIVFVVTAFTILGHGLDKGLANRT